MALATALDELARGPDAALTTPAAFLDAHPSSWSVEIAPRTSWSCPHGVVRWHADCGCGSAGGDESGTGQAWRGPLRDALEHLRDCAVELLLTRGRRALADPEEAAEDYGRVVADGQDETLEAFLRRHVRRPEDPAARREATALMEMQRHALLMFASCGWFFGALDRPEPVLCLRHAARAAELAGELGDGHVQDTLLGDLARVPGPSAEVPEGEALWRLRVLPARARAPRSDGGEER
jgi:alpha-amylase/alpha-mannosidase (GH57 family)